MKRKVIKYGIFGIIILALGWNLSQCTGGNPGNMKQYEIINQIKTKMKNEMDAINFEVNFEDYEFKVEVPQSLSDFGYVTLKDKRYNYEPIRVYDGNLQKLEEDKIGVNPIIFVAHGYQDYVDNVLLNDKTRGNNLDEALRVSNGKLNEKYNLGGVSQTLNAELGRRVSLQEVEQNIGSKGDYYILPTSISREEYINFFKNKKSREIEYHDFVEKMDYIVLVVIDTKENITKELENKVQSYCNKEYTTFVLRKGE